MVDRVPEERCGGLALEKVFQLGASALEMVAEQDVTSRSPVVLAGQLIIEAGGIRAHAKDAGSHLRLDRAIVLLNEGEKAFFEDQLAVLRILHFLRPLVPV